MTNYQYDAAGRLIRKTNANGNTIQKNATGQIQNYVYDVNNRLIQVKDGSNNIIATYTYDPFGRRIKKSVPPSGGGSGRKFITCTPTKV